MGEEMPRKRKKQESRLNWVFYIAFVVLVFWIIKMILKIDPPFDDVLSNIPWISVAFGAGALYAKVALISKDVDDVQDKLDKIADVSTKTSAIEKNVDCIQNDLKQVRDMANQIKGKLGIP
jgi:uncharacterized protein YoxC